MIDNTVSLSTMFSSFGQDLLSAEDYADIAMSDMTDAFSLLLFSYRTAHNLTQEQLAGQLGMTQAMVSSYEAGKRNISIRKVSEISARLGFSVSLTFAPLQAGNMSDTIQPEQYTEQIAEEMAAAA